MQSEIACVILGAGLGSRMRSDRPKVLHPVAHEPMIAHVCRACEGLPVARRIVVAGPEMGTPPAALAGWDCVVQQERRGTGDAVKTAREALDGFSGPVVVLFGDTPLVSPRTIESLAGAIAGREGPALAVLAMEPEEPGTYGRIVLDSRESVAAIVEYPDASPAQRAITLCNAGLMAFDGARLFALLDGLGTQNAQGEYYLTDAVEIAREKGWQVTHRIAPAEDVLGVNSRADLAKAEAAMQGRLRARALEAGVTLTDPQTVWLSADTRFGRDVEIGPSVQIGPGTVIGDRVSIRAFCHIEGARIGDGAIVGPFARLRPGADLGADVHIGNFVEAKNARLGQGAKANHLTYLGDAVIGPKTNVGAGTITCNYDGARKHVTTIGADVSIGSNTAFIAPVTVGDESVIAAGSVITQDVEPRALAMSRAPQEQKPEVGLKIKHRNAAAKAAELKGGKG